MKNSKYFLSVVVPLFNEETRLENLIKIDHFFKMQKINFQLIVVNDGSMDQTFTMLKKLKLKFNFTLISYLKNEGKGYALKMGIEKAQGSYILFTDVDLSTPLSEYKKFEPYLEKFDIIIGTRKNSQSNILKHQTALREYLGKKYTILSNFILSTNVSDFTCGFKCFKNSSAKQIFSKMRIKRWGFDSEILFLAHKFKYKIKEVPVTWINDERSKVKLPQDLIVSSRDLAKIRINDIAGKYS